MCGLVPGDANMYLCCRIQELPVVRMAQRLIRKSHDREKRREVVGAMLKRCTALTGSTCTRRAQTMLAWMDWVEHCESGPARADGFSLTSRRKQLTIDFR